MFYATVVQCDYMHNMADPTNYMYIATYVDCDWLLACFTYSIIITQWTIDLLHTYIHDVLKVNYSSLPINDRVAVAVIIIGGQGPAVTVP